MPHKTKKERLADKDLLVKIRDRFHIMLEADEENRRLGLDDMRFINVPGEQWENNMKKERGARPCYEFNKLRVTSKRIINDMKANPAQGKVRGMSEEDKGTAEIIEGLIRNIWNASDADTVIDRASEYQVGAGMGAWRVVTKFSTDNAFDQDIEIEEIPNPFCLYADPSAKDQLKRDADDWILTEKISNKSFKSQWPDAEKVDFEETEFDNEDEWEDDESVRIAEYWWKEPTIKTIFQLQDGKVIDSETDEAANIDKALIKKTRVIKTHKIMMTIVSGDSILEPPVEWAGSEHPFVMIYGEYLIIDGKTYWYGIGRFGKDAQRSYNVSRTAITETIASAPQSKYWATTAQAKGQLDNWSIAHKENMPFQLFTPDPLNPGPPQRMGGADVPIALIQESQLASEEINMVTGIFAADVGSANQASSGRQEIARQQQGQIATFNYQDNRGKGILRTWEILIDLIPKIYDTEREVRIIGTDQADSYLKVNTFTQDDQGLPVKINDLSVGRYDVAVTIGPNFTSRRQEAAETYQTLMQGNPNIFPIAGDLIFKSMDLPFAEEIAERLKIMLPPEIQNLINDEQEVPAEIQIMMQQAEQALQAVEQQAQAVQEAAQQVGLDKAEVEKLTANLQTEEAQFEAKIAQEVAKLAAKGANLTIQEVKVNREEFIQTGKEEVDAEGNKISIELAQELAASVEVIQNMAAQFNQVAVETLADIKEAAEKKPKLVRVDAVRKDGKLSAIPVFSDDKTIN